MEKMLKIKYYIIDEQIIISYSTGYCDWDFTANKIELNLSLSKESI